MPLLFFKKNDTLQWFFFLTFFLIGSPVKASQIIDTIGSYIDLKLYAGSADTVYINHERYFGLFTKDTCSVEDHGTTITTISGCWKRIHSNFSPKFWAIGGQSNDNRIGRVLKEVDAINCAAIAAGIAGGDTIEIDSMYNIDRPVFLISNNTYLGTADSCGFRRSDPPVTILTDTAKVNDNKILVQDNSGFRSFQNFNIANGQAFDSIAGHVAHTASVSQALGGDTTIFVSGLKIQRQMLPGDSVSLFFHMMTPRFTSLDSIHLKNLIFDGNSAKYNLNYDWRSNKTLQIPTTSHCIIEQCRFYEIPAENTFLCGAIFKDCSGSNLNGSIVHFSCNSFERPTEILYNNFSNTNLIGNSIMKHSEAGFTFSAKVQNFRIAYNQVENIREYGVGIFRNDDSSNEITDNLLNSELETIGFQFGYLYPETNIIYNNKNRLSAVDTSSQSCWLKTPQLVDSFSCAGNSSLNNPLDIGDTITITIDSLLLRKSNENFVKSISPIYDEDYFNLVDIKIKSPNLSSFHQWVYIDSSSTQKSIVFDNGHRNGLQNAGNWGYEGCSQVANCTDVSFYFEVINLPTTIKAVDCPLTGFELKFDGEIGTWDQPIYCSNQPIFFAPSLLGLPVLNKEIITSFNPENHPTLIDIFPNPSHQYIEVRHLNLVETTYQILNLTGQPIQTGTSDSNKLAIGHLAQGIYFLKINSKTKTYYGIFTKM